MGTDTISHSSNALTGLGSTYGSIKDTVDSLVSVFKGLRAAHSTFAAFQTLSTHFDRVSSENATLGDALVALSVLTEFYEKQGGQLPGSLQLPLKALSDFYLPHRVRSYWKPYFDLVSLVASGVFASSAPSVGGARQTDLEDRDHIDVEVWVVRADGSPEENGDTTRKVRVTVPVIALQGGVDSRANSHLDDYLRKQAQFQGFKIQAINFAQRQDHVIYGEMSDKGVLSFGPFSASQYVEALRMAGLLQGDDLGEACKPEMAHQDGFHLDPGPFCFAQEDQQMRKMKAGSAWAALQRLKGEEGFSPGEKGE